MATLTAYSTSADGYIESNDYPGAGGYSVARNGTGNLIDGSGSTGGYVGQSKSGSFSSVFESFISFDTSSIPTGATINSATLSLYGIGDFSTTDFTLEARVHDWGATMTTADFVAGGSLSGKTRVATLSSSGFTVSGYNTMTEDGTNLRSNINKGGITRFVICSNRTVSNTTPTGNEFVTISLGATTGNSQDPKLVITYTNLQSVTGTITMSGVLTKRVNKPLSGATGTISGAFQSGRLFAQSIVGSIATVTGSVAKLTGKPLSGDTTGTGNVTKKTSKSFAGTMGSLSASINATKVAIMQLSGSVGNITGALTSAQHQFGVNLTGTMGSVSGSVAKGIRKTLSRSMSSLTGNATSLSTFKSAIMKAGSVVRRTIQGGRDR